MSVSFDYLQRFSALTGYAIGQLEKVVRLGEIAADIFRHPFFGKEPSAQRWNSSQSLLWPTPQAFSGS
jgi:hypothetical protein